MRHRIGFALLALHISVALYVLLAMLVWLMGDSLELERAAIVALTVFCFLIAIGLEVVAFGLQCRRYWAWVAGLCIFGLYVSSLFFPLGALGLWGLLAPGTREEFGVNPARRRASQEDDC